MKKLYKGNGHVWNIRSMSDFSIVTILLPRMFTDYTAWQNHPILGKISYPGVKEPVIYLETFKGTKLLMLLSNLVASEPLSPQNKTNFRNPQKVYHSFIIGPTWDNIAQMQ